MCVRTDSQGGSRYVDELWLIWFQHSTQQPMKDKCRNQSEFLFALQHQLTVFYPIDWRIEQQLQPIEARQEGRARLLQPGRWGRSAGTFHCHSCRQARRGMMEKCQPPGCQDWQDRCLWERGDLPANRLWRSCCGSCSTAGRPAAVRDGEWRSSRKVGAKEAVEQAGRHRDLSVYRLLPPLHRLVKRLHSHPTVWGRMLYDGTEAGFSCSSLSFVCLIDLQQVSRWLTGVIRRFLLLN